MANAILEGTSTTNLRLAEAFLQRARLRLEALGSLRAEADFSDVIREARDIVELCFRGMLRIVGIAVPRWLDIADAIRDGITKLPADVAMHRDRIMEIHRDLKMDWRAAPSGNPAAHADKLFVADADRACAEAEWILDLAQLTIDIVSRRRAPTPQI